MSISTDTIAIAKVVWVAFVVFASVYITIRTNRNQNDKLLALFFLTLAFLTGIFIKTRIPWHGWCINFVFGNLWGCGYYITASFLDRVKPGWNKEENKKEIT